MSATTRTLLAELKWRYVRLFDLAIEDVVTEEWEDEDGCVYVPSRPDLPKWKIK